LERHGAGNVEHVHTSAKDLHRETIEGASVTGVVAGVSVAV
jgi:hypothetical protein